MAELRVEDDELVLHLTNVEKLEGVHGDLRVRALDGPSRPSCRVARLGRLRFNVEVDRLTRRRTPRAVRGRATTHREPV
jgi:hypothetical protein